LKLNFAFKLTPLNLWSFHIFLKDACLRGACDLNTDFDAHLLELPRVILLLETKTKLVLERQLTASECHKCLFWCWGCTASVGNGHVHQPRDLISHWTQMRWMPLASGARGACDVDGERLRPGCGRVSWWHKWSWRGGRW